MKEHRTLAPTDLMRDPKSTIKPGQFACPLAKLRALVERNGGLSDSDKADTQQRALRRSLNSLRDKGFVGMLDDYAWLVDRPDKGGQT